GRPPRALRGHRGQRRRRDGGAGRRHDRPRPHRRQPLPRRPGGPAAPGRGRAGVRLLSGPGPPSGGAERLTAVNLMASGAVLGWPAMDGSPDLDLLRIRARQEMEPGEQLRWVGRPHPWALARQRLAALTVTPVLLGLGTFVIHVGASQPMPLEQAAVTMVFY